MSVLEQAAYGFVSSYTHPDISGATFAIGLCSLDGQAQAMLAGLEDHPVDSVARCLSEIGFSTPTDSCEAVVFQLRWPLSHDGSDPARDDLRALIDKLGMDWSAGFAETSQPHELATPMDCWKPHRAAELAGALAGLPCVVNAWLVQLAVLTDTFPDDDGDLADDEGDNEQPDDGSDAEGGGDDRDP